MATRECLDPGQRARFEEERAAQIVERSRFGSSVGFLFCMALAWLLPRQLPPELRSFAMLQALIVSGILAVAVGFTFLAPGLLKKQPGIYITLIANAIATCIGLESALTGGFGSPLGFAIILVWLFGAVVVPLGIPWFVANIVMSWAIVYGLILTRSAEHGPAGVITLLLVGAASLCITGGVLRDQAARRAFLAREQLDALNGQLAERVQEQVKEIVERAHEVELLNEQLRERVQERSRELAAALRQLGKIDAGDGRLQPGQTVGRVKIGRLLGEGGMGSVYAGIDLLTNREVALKVLRPGVADVSALQRFVGEAAAAAAISHPGVIKTMHIDVSSDGRLYQIMELVDGPTLERRMTQAPLRPGETARIGAGIAAALAAAHDKDVVHRDIKPNNVILARAPAGVRLLDFGLSKMRGGGPLDATQTAAQQLLGTPAYMSPEQVQDAGSVGTATDVYSLGVLLYRLAGGRMPFEGKTLTSLLSAHLHERPRPLAEVAPEVPAALAALIERTLQKEPGARPTAAALANELDAIADALGAPSLATICAHEPAAEDGTGPTMAQRSV